MLTLLKITISGYKMLPDHFTIDLTTKARVNDEECADDSEVFEIAENLHTFNMVAFTGSNSSGKSSTLELISKVLILMTTGRWVFVNHDFNSDKIILHVEFYLNGSIYLYDSKILKRNDVDDFILASPYCQITDEIVKYAHYKPIYGKRYDELHYAIDDTSTGVEDTSKLVFICKDNVAGYLMNPFSLNRAMGNGAFFESLRLFNDRLTSEIIRLLDDSIEYIKYLGSDSVKFKRFGERGINISRIELLHLLSNGTIKGIELYIRVVNVLRCGGILLIDEIENCFHKNLVNNILYLFMDKTLNRKNAQIFFTTHYVEILDTFNRRDNIFVMHKKGVKISIANVYEDFNLRSEILKSKQFNKNTFNTLLNYERLMTVKRLIKNEVLSDD